MEVEEVSDPIKDTTSNKNDENNRDANLKDKSDTTADEFSGENSVGMPPDEDAKDEAANIGTSPETEKHSQAMAIDSEDVAVSSSADTLENSKELLPASSSSTIDKNEPSQEVSIDYVETSLTGEMLEHDPMDTSVTDSVKPEEDPISASVTETVESQETTATNSPKVAESEGKSLPGDSTQEKDKESDPNLASNLTEEKSSQEDQNEIESEEKDDGRESTMETATMIDENFTQSTPEEEMAKSQDTLTQTASQENPEATSQEMESVSLENFESNSQENDETTSQKNYESASQEGETEGLRDICDTDKSRLRQEDPIECNDSNSETISADETNSNKEQSFETITVNDDDNSRTDVAPASFNVLKIGQMASILNQKLTQIIDEQLAAPMVSSTRSASTTNSTTYTTKTIIISSNQSTASKNYCPDGRETYVEVCDYEAKNTCFICHRFRIMKYNFIFRPAKTKDVRNYLCCDVCLDSLKALAPYLTTRQYFAPFTPVELVDSNYKYVRKCRRCGRVIKGFAGVYSWEAMDFCKETCLYRFQKLFTKKCSECGHPVAYTQLGKYSVRFGSIIRQFCSSACLETKKRKIKICSYCQKSIIRTRTVEGTKCFCNNTCKGMYTNLQKANRLPYVDGPTPCFACGSQNDITMEFDYHGKNYYFCANNCFILFKFIQNIDTPIRKCHTCNKSTLLQYLEKYALFYDNLLHYFCSMTCQHIYVITHRRVIPCVWCKVKKYNFDMIQKNSFMGTTIFVCSLFCMNQLKVSTDALIKSRQTCFNCCQINATLDVSLSDGTTKSFCSNECINVSQLNTTNAFTIGRPKRNRYKALPEKPGPLPVITNVRSLASKEERTPPISKLVVVQEPRAPQQANVMCLVKPMVTDQETSITKDTTDKEQQTDVLNTPKLKIICVPIYVPQPLPMWRVPVPKAVPFPLVVPIPFLVTLTKKSAEGYFKEIKQKDNAVKAPADPFEADLLMMAELIAAEKKEESPEPPEPDMDTTEDFSPEPADATFGDDVLSMALKLATNDLPEPAVDLEGALTASTITPTQQQPNLDLMESRNVLTPTRGTRGRRRGGRAPGRSPRGGRGRGRPPCQESMPSPEPVIPQPLPEPVEKPDANMCLKYTFGVNAWKQWVTNKNADLERSSRRLKLFNTDLLQLTADELNYSLCLFVNEVRKPNGAEYAPDTIYYLCLGIQQYLYENGRIDNIFCDSYYEKFTDALDEICKKFTNLYSNSYYIVTRVEEEHLWESRQLGAHSPHVLLSTLMFFNTKHFNLTTVEEHMQLSFSHIMKHWKRNPNQSAAITKQMGNRNVLLRFYPPQTPGAPTRKKKVYEQQENEQNPLRCPVKLYEFYLSKCPESVKNRNDVFYLLPERSCVPDSPVWYSTMALDTNALSKMLHRVKMVKEINVALLTH